MDIKRTAFQRLVWAMLLQEVVTLLYLGYKFKLLEDIRPLFSWSFWDLWPDLTTNLCIDIPYYALAYAGVYLYYRLTMNHQLR